MFYYKPLAMIGVATLLLCIACGQSSTPGNGPGPEDTSANRQDQRTDKIDIVNDSILDTLRIDSEVQDSDGGEPDLYRDCGEGKFCAPDGSCTPVPDHCENKECGNNGYGQLCGVCPPGETCGPFNLCVPACVPACQFRDCGPDGCGGSCGTCPDDTPYCNRNWCEEKMAVVCHDEEGDSHFCGSVLHHQTGRSPRNDGIILPAGF